MQSEAESESEYLTYPRGNFVVTIAPRQQGQ